MARQPVRKSQLLKSMGKPNTVTLDIASSGRQLGAGGHVTSPSSGQRSVSSAATSTVTSSETPRGGATELHKRQNATSCKAPRHAC
eukprot:751504-Amphidinium_carterae.1